MGVGPVDNDFELEPDDPGELFLGDDLFPAVDTTADPQKVSMYEGTSTPTL
jgi:hypothetical protein